jgi:uncharacterized protein (DUF305 family)
MAAVLCAADTATCMLTAAARTPRAARPVRPEHNPIRSAGACRCVGAKPLGLNHCGPQRKSSFASDSCGRQPATTLAVDDWIERVDSRRRRRFAVGMNSRGPRPQIQSPTRAQAPDPVSTKRRQPTHPASRRQGQGYRDIHYASVVPSLTARITAALAACATALFLSSCHSSPSDNHAHSTRTDDKPVITGEPAGYNTADVAFANSMTAYQEQGINMSRLVPDRSDNSDLVAFAAKTAAALQVDTQVLNALRAQWKEGQDNQPRDGGPSTTTGGMIDSATIAKLESLHGPDFDTLWLTSMISLDRGTIELANAEAAGGKNVDAVSLAKQIAKARQDEIGQMQQMLAR